MDRGDRGAAFFTNALIAAGQTIEIDIQGAQIGHGGEGQRDLADRVLTGAKDEKRHAREGRDDGRVGHGKDGGGVHHHQVVVHWPSRPAL